MPIFMAAHLARSAPFSQGGKWPQRRFATLTTTWESAHNVPMRYAPALLAVLAALGLTHAVRADDTYMNIPTRPGVEERFVLVEPPNPVASAIIFTGSAGLIEPRPGKLGNNFLIRSRETFAARGI